MLLVFRSTTYIGVFVEFVAAVAWVAEIFDDPKQREAALGYTQAFSSIGGLMVTGAYAIAVTYSQQLPGDCRRPLAVALHADLGRHPGAAADPHPAVPAGVARLAGEEGGGHAASGRRSPRIFTPELRRTTIVTTIMFACAYGAAFGAIQQMPRIVPGPPGGADDGAAAATADGGGRAGLSGGRRAGRDASRSPSSRCASSRAGS